jgi:hypothetical protein
MTHRASTLIASALVLLAGGTGLLWPKSNIAAEDTIKPLPVRTLSFREGSPPVSQALQWLPPWLDADASPPPPAWTVRTDGLWVPWTMGPPAWLATVTQGYVVAETVPLPPERPAHLLETEPPAVSSSKPPQKRIAREADLCERHGLKKTHTDKYRWRCR